MKNEALARGPTQLEGLEFCELCSWYADDTVAISVGHGRQPRVCGQCRWKLRRAEDDSGKPGES